MLCFVCYGNFIQKYFGFSLIVFCNTWFYCITSQINTIPLKHKRTRVMKLILVGNDENLLFLSSPKSCRLKSFVSSSSLNPQNSLTFSRISPSRFTTLSFDSQRNMSPSPLWLSPSTITLPHSSSSPLTVDDVSQLSPSPLTVAVVSHCCRRLSPSPSSLNSHRLLSPSHITVTSNSLSSK